MVDGAKLFLEFESGPQPEDSRLLTIAQLGTLSAGFGRRISSGAWRMS